MQPSTDTFLGRLLAAVERELEGAVELRHRLHEHPELAHEEHGTAAIIERALPVEALTAAGTGKIARVGSPDGRAVVLRAELDGLPVQERTEAPYRAVGGVMHACGHDVHMAALVALVRAAHSLADSLPAPLVAVFQPSEEAYPSGAEELAREALPLIAPGAIVAAHVHPDLAWGTVAIDPGTVNASSDNIEIVVEGEPSHGAYPHHGRDPILAIAHVVVGLHAQLARRIDPLSPAVLTIGVLEGGEAENVIPARARALRLAARAQAGGPSRRCGRWSRRSSRGSPPRTAAAQPPRSSPASQRFETTRRSRRSPASCCRARGSQPAAEWRSCGSDDFAFFGALAPLAMGFVGLAGAEGFAQRPLHHPELLPPDSAVGAVARAQAVLYAAAAAWLTAPSR